jgi:hypothetical protein
MTHLPSEERGLFNDCRLYDLLPWENTPRDCVHCVFCSVGPELALIKSVPIPTLLEEVSWVIRPIQLRTCLFAAYMLIDESCEAISLSSSCSTTFAGAKNSTKAFWNT